MGVAGSSRGGGRDQGRGRGGGRQGRPARAGSTGGGSTGAGSTGASGASPSSGENGAAAGVLKLTIRSDFDAGRDVQERILEQVKRHGFGTDATFAIRIALEEALVNAIKHGNRQDPEKTIHI